MCRAAHIDKAVLGKGGLEENFGLLKQSIWLPHWDTGTLFHPP